MKSNPMRLLFILAVAGGAWLLMGGGGETGLNFRDKFDAVVSQLQSDDQDVSWEGQEPSPRGWNGRW